MLNVKGNLYEHCWGKCLLDGQDKIMPILIGAQERSASAVLLYQFWFLLIFLVLGRLATSVVCNLADTICFQLLGKFKILLFLWAAYNESYRHYNYILCFCPGKTLFLP